MNKWMNEWMNEWIKGTLDFKAPKQMTEVQTTKHIVKFRQQKTKV